MTYFPDLTDYAYGNDECDERYLNVGWLEAGQPFATAEVSPLLASALVLCARRPVRLYRGFHTCDLCPGESDVDAPLSIRWQDGPAASLGDGEICVQGPDERWYAAPSLVAHYVIHHEYRPPKGFCHGVIDRAKEIVVLDLAEVDAIHDMDLSACFERCIDVVESLRLTHPDRSALEEFVLAARKLFAMVESQSLDIANPPSEVRVVEGQAGLSEELIFIPRAVARLISHVHRGTTEGVHKLVVDLIERAQERGVK